MLKPATIILLLVASAWSATNAHAADTPLLGGIQVQLLDDVGVDRDMAKIVFSRDPALKTTLSPLCPAVTKLRLRSDGQTNPDVTLDCKLWRRSGTGFRYVDPLGTRGGVRTVIYQPNGGRLVVKMKGIGYTALTSPLASVDLGFSIGTAGFCGRFEHFKRNNAYRVVANPPSGACTGCGNGVKENAEQCDDGNKVNGDGCDANCTASACGNGVEAGAEACDDGNVANGDGCRADCTVEKCGDGKKDPQEQCDDGNTSPGDCCSATCTFEASGSACATDDDVCTDDVCNGAGACAHPANTASCDDENACTEHDTCANGVCAGTNVAPWINELDYDGGSTGGAPDKDEMVEIAAPAGSDLSGFQLVVVEGNQLCGTGTAANGAASLAVTIPDGTVIGDDTGTGIGFLVACFANTSANVVAAGKCDVMLPGPDTLSNLGDGHLLNLDRTTCPDGVALVDPASGVVDTVSWEGVVPNTGPYGPAFNVTPYDAGQDQGQKLGVSLEKRTSGFARATSASEWHLSGSCTDASALDSTCVENSSSPGAPNPGQAFQCASVVCGDGVRNGREECDEGDANSDAPDATCRTDCTAQRCGDGIVDPGAGEQCEATADCGSGFTCRACGCFTSFDFTVVPGPADSAPVDDGQFSWLKISPLFGQTNATQGDFNPGPLKVARTAPGPDGKAELVLLEPAYVGAHLPSAAGSGRVCFRIEQDPDALGEIDCDGGTNYDVLLTADSNGTSAEGPQTLTVGAGATDSGAGAGVLRVLLFGATTSDDTTPCTAATYVTTTKTALTTAIATSEITDTRQGGSVTSTLTGKPYACGPWSTDGPASIALPNVTFDFVLPFGLGTQDVAQVLRLNDQ